MSILYTKINKKLVKVLTLPQAGLKLKISRQAVLKRINSGQYRAVRMTLHDTANHNVYLIPISELRKK